MQDCNYGYRKANSFMFIGMKKEENDIIQSTHKQRKIRGSDHLNKVGTLLCSCSNARSFNNGSHVVWTGDFYSTSFLQWEISSWNSTWRNTSPWLSTDLWNWWSGQMLMMIFLQTSMSLVMWTHSNDHIPPCHSLRPHIIIYLCLFYHKFSSCYILQFYLFIT